MKTNMEKHLQWWKETTTSDQYKLIKQYIDHSSNGLIDKSQQALIKEFLGDSPQTAYFIGRICFHLEGMPEITNLVQQNTKNLRALIEFETNCKEVLNVLEESFPKLNQHMSEKQEILRRAFPWNWNHDSTKTFDASKHCDYVDIEALKVNLNTIIKNSQREKRDPMYKLAVKRQGGRRNMNLELFSGWLVSDFWSIYQKYPTLSETSNDYQAISIIYDAFGYNAVDQLKEIKRAVKLSKDQARPQK